MTSLFKISQKGFDYSPYCSSISSSSARNNKHGTLLKSLSAQHTKRGPCNSRLKTEIFPTDPKSFCDRLFYSYIGVYRIDYILPKIDMILRQSSKIFGIIFIIKRVVFAFVLAINLEN